MNVFITGGTSGIGLALVRRYCRDGHRVGVFALPGSADDPVFSAGPQAPERYEGDVRDAAGLREAVARFARGRLDLMVACAGINQPFAVPAWPDHDRERAVIEVNLLGVLNAFAAAQAVMARAGGGHLVALASASGLIGVPGHAGYTASKAAVITLCEAYAIELAHHGIRVSCFAPGFVATPLMAGNPDPMPFLLTADQAAERIVRAVAAGREFVVFPWPIAAVGYLLKSLPRVAYRALFRRAFARQRRRRAAGLPPGR